jgi:hypothetical protein
MKADNTARKQEAIALIAAFVTNGPSKSQEWILDSGATHHMCHSRKLFESYVPNESSERAIETAGGMVRAEGFGTVRLNLITSAGMQKEVVLNDVYYLPELPVNLFSSNRIRQKGYYIDGLAQTLRNRLNREELCAFDETGTFIQIKTAKPAVQIFTASSRRQELRPIELWHRRFGHLGPENVLRTAAMTTGVAIPASTADSANLAKKKPLILEGGFKFKPPSTIRCIPCTHHSKVAADAVEEASDKGSSCFRADPYRCDRTD